MTACHTGCSFSPLTPQADWMCSTSQSAGSWRTAGSDGGGGGSRTPAGAPATGSLAPTITAPELYEGSLAPPGGPSFFSSAHPSRPCDLIWFLYVKHEDRARFEAEGWQFAADLGPTHGRWSVLMQYHGEGMPPHGRRHNRAKPCGPA